MRKIIFRYSTQRWSPDQAEMYVSGLLLTIQRLADFPELGEAIGRGKSRRLVYQRHVVLYRYAQDRVTILRIISVRAATPLEFEEEL